MTQIIWKLPAGGIAITTLVDAANAEAEAAKLLETGLIDAGWQVDHVRDDDHHFEITDPAFFDALTTEDGEIVTDMSRARDIWRAAIREARAPKLAALDVAWQRADERDDADAKKSVASAKQTLRDLPADPAITKAKTVANLRAFWPDILT